MNTANRFCSLALICLLVLTVFVGGCGALTWSREKSERNNRGYQYRDYGTHTSISAYGDFRTGSYYRSQHHGHHHHSSHCR